MTIRITPGTLVRAGRLAASDVTRGYALLASALARIDDTRLGYPTGGDGGDETGDSIVERMALGSVDDARRDLDRLLRIVERLGVDARDFAALVDRWTTVNGKRPTGRNVRDRWCVSCARFGHSTNRAANRLRCRWCDEYHRANDADPPRALVEKHLSGERITKDDLARAARKQKR